MPFIDQASRALYAPGIKAIVDRMPTDRRAARGDLTYVITEILHQYYGEKMRYADHADLISVLQCAQLEYYCGRVHPYEVKKLQEHGDIYKDSP